VRAREGRGELGRLSTAGHFQSENTSEGRYQSESTGDTFRAEDVPRDGLPPGRNHSAGTGRTLAAALPATPTRLGGPQINPTSTLAPR